MGADGDAGAFPSGKKHDADTPQQHSTANGTTNNSEPHSKNPEIRADHTDASMNEAVSDELQVSTAQKDNNANHDTIAQDSSRDLMDDNGEEVEEAAEDTVIY